MADKNCILSVIVPVYGVENYLAGCLDSIYPQLTDETEIILVDDESPDNCGAVCDGYKEKYPDFTTVIHQKNKGLGGARDSGIEIAKGNYLLFVDSDDTIVEGTVETLLRTIREKSPDCIVFPINCTDESGKVLSVQKDIFTPDTPIDPSTEKAVLCGLPAACNKVFKASLFRDNGIEFPSRVWYEDIRTTPKLFALSKSVVYLDTPLYNYLQRSDSIMNNKNVERNHEIIDATDELIRYFKEKGIYEKFRDEIDYLIIDHVLISATVRVLRTESAKHPLIGEFREYTKKNCKSISKNPHLKTMDRNRKIVLSLIRKKMYFAVKAIFR